MTASFKTDTFTPDRLIAQNAHLLIHEPIVLLSGQNCLRGTLLGKITATGKCVKSLSASSDGSQTPVAILAEDTDASLADKATVAYFRGDFDASAVIFGTAHTAASTKAGLRTNNIELIATQGGV